MLWRLGAVFALALGAGALAGSLTALKHAGRIALPLLAVVAALLLARLTLGV